MKNKKRRKSTIKALNAMIEHADKGPSGFWTDDFEGCGNPEIFPEFEKGLKKGDFIRIEHDACPWDEDIMYGCDDGVCSGGCYHRCRLRDVAKVLKEDELRALLIRFKERVLNDDYANDKKDITPLLTEDEAKIIDDRLEQRHAAFLKKCDQERAERAKKAERLIKKYPRRKEILEEFYGKITTVQTEGGVVFFSADDGKKVVGCENWSYEDYIDVSLASLDKPCRMGLVGGFMGDVLSFKGEIESKNSGFVCFKRLFIDGMQGDGCCYLQKEDHVWMEKDGFERFKKGDCVSFVADVYRYLKTGNGKQIDYGLRDPWDINPIERYMLPSDQQITLQWIQQIICETCLFTEKCNHFFCLRNEKEINELKENMFKLTKKQDGHKEIIKHFLELANNDDEYKDMLKKIMNEKNKD